MFRRVEGKCALRHHIGIAVQRIIATHLRRAEEIRGPGHKFQVIAGGRDADKQVIAAGVGHLAGDQRIIAAVELHGHAGQSHFTTVLNAVRVEVQPHHITQHGIRHRIADVADPVEIDVRLVAVGHKLAVIHPIGHAVAIVVGITGVAVPVAVGIALIGVADQRAVIGVIRHAVAIGIQAQVTHIPDSVAITVLLVRIGREGAVIDVIRHAVTITVGVGIARIPDAIAIGIGLIGIRHEWAVIAQVRDSIPVYIIVFGITRIPDAVPIRISLVRVGHQWAVIGVVRDAVAVRILEGFAHVPDPVSIRVSLIGVIGRGAVIGGVGDTVAINVIIVEQVTRVPDAVMILVFLEGVKRDRAVVVVVEDAVAIHVFRGRVNRGDRKIFTIGHGYRQLILVGVACRVFNLQHNFIGTGRRAPPDQIERVFVKNKLFVGRSRDQHITRPQREPIRVENITRPDFQLVGHNRADRAPEAPYASRQPGFEIKNDLRRHGFTIGKIDLAVDNAHLRVAAAANDQHRQFGRAIGQPGHLAGPRHRLLPAERRRQPRVIDDDLLPVADIQRHDETRLNHRAAPKPQLDQRLRRAG